MHSYVFSSNGLEAKLVMSCVCMVLDVISCVCSVCLVLKTQGSVISAFCLRIKMEEQ